ncbi:MAG: iron ABC transporter permease [Anaerolineae bacterium]|nr:iron ABC transporter permease [Anaerolineae bacterium]
MSRVLWRGLLLVPLIFLGLFFFYPLASIFMVSLSPEGVLDLTGFTRLVSSRYYIDTILFTLFQATLSTLLTIALALPGAYVFTRYRFPGKSLLLSVITLPFVLPTIVVAAAFTALIGPRGILNQILISAFSLPTPPIQLDRTLSIILIVHVFYNYAVALRIITGYWANLNPRIEQAAQILGANSWNIWWRIRLPILRPAIMAAGALVFIFTFTSFGVVLLLGGPQYATVEVEIYRQAANLFNLQVAAALSLVQIGFMFVLMFVYTNLQRRITSEVVSAQQAVKTPRLLREKVLVTGNIVFMALMLFTPLIALVIQSFTVGGTGFTLEYYRLLGVNTRQSVLFVPPLEAIRNSVIFAGVTTVLAVGIGIISAYLLIQRTRWSRLFDPIFMLPLATSAVTLGFGFIIALDEPPLNLRQSAALIPIAHTLVAMPFVIRSILPALRSIPPNIREAAAVLGASPLTIWRKIELPLITRSILVGATFAFTMSMGEFGASLFVARPEFPTIPIAIFRLIGQPGGANYGQALAMSSILMLVSAVAFLLIERLRTTLVGEF